MRRASFRRAGYEPPVHSAYAHASGAVEIPIQGMRAASRNESGRLRIPRMKHANSSSVPKPRPERLVHVIQGEYGVSRDPDLIFTTILGSCVATCMWDHVAGVGGMNHFLLPGERDDCGESMRYGVNAMELLINGLLQNGASRSRLQAKLFGGAHVIRSLGDIGAQNAEFATRFLNDEGISCVAQSLGGNRARRVRFWPTSGRAGQLLLESTSPEVMIAERARAVPAPAAEGSVELF